MTLKKEFPRSRDVLLALTVLVALSVAGCAAPSVRQQRLVARPNMVFSDSAVFNYNSSRLLPQVASGFASSAGSQNSGCTSCR